LFEIGTSELPFDITMNVLLFLIAAVVVQCQNATSKMSINLQIQLYDGTSLAPTRYGIVLFRGFAELDIFGPSEAPGILALSTYMNISLIAKTLEPVPSSRMS
jgi:hypothetical protein